MLDICSLSPASQARRVPQAKGANVKHAKDCFLFCLGLGFISQGFQGANVKHAKDRFG